MIKAEVVQLYPNSTMRKVFKEYCDARHYYWNLGLETWNRQYEAHKKEGTSKPSGYSVRNYLVANREEWEKKLPSRVLRHAINDLSEAWKHFLRKDTPDWGKPKFHSKKRLDRMGFKLENIRFDGLKLYLTKPQDYKENWFPIRFKGSKNIKRGFKIIGHTSFFTEGGRYYAAFTYEVDDIEKIEPSLNLENAIDLNVGKFTDAEGDFDILPKKLIQYYKKIKWYQRRLAKKRTKNRKWKESKSYEKTRTKLNRMYKRATNFQRDLVKKYINRKLSTYSSITIEDLNVKKMKMGVTSKGLHRSLFGFFRKWIEFKSQEYNVELLIADRYYPSTQRCSVCGNIKTGDEKIGLNGNAKHKTPHDTYICYFCGYHGNRDDNAFMNLIDYKHLKHRDWSAVGTQDGEAPVPEEVRVGQCVFRQVRKTEHQC